MKNHIKSVKISFKMTKLKILVKIVKLKICIASGNKKAAAGTMGIAPDSKPTGPPRNKTAPSIPRGWH